jgi:hypothetical protein
MSIWVSIVDGKLIKQVAEKEKTYIKLIKQVAEKEKTYIHVYDGKILLHFFDCCGLC